MESFTAECNRTIKELKIFLQKNKEFVHSGAGNGGRIYEECRQDYKEAVRELKEAQADYQKDPDRATAVVLKACS